MDGRDSAAATGVEELQKVEGLPAANLALTTSAQVYLNKEAYLLVREDAIKGSLNTHAKSGYPSMLFPCFGCPSPK
jgi:hypothetical protein